MDSLKRSLDSRTDRRKSTLGFHTTISSGIRSWELVVPHSEPSIYGIEGVGDHLIKT